MKKHNGMRPHDVVILLKIIALDNENWMMKDIANTLYISSSEVSESLKRSAWAGFISYFSICCVRNLRPRFVFIEVRQKSL